MDDGFLSRFARELAALPRVEAVALGGSRAQGTARPDSDWDFAIYYRGTFDPENLRALGYSGEVSELGAWGGGVFNGGAWLEVDERRVDVHYRDLGAVEHELREAEAGRVRVEPLAFHLAGIPTYLLVAELAVNQVLRGSLPRPEYPEALRRAAYGMWSDAARIHLEYARAAHASHGRAAQTIATLTRAATQAAHAILAARREWVTNDKGLLERAGLDELDALVTAAAAERDSLLRLCHAADALCSHALDAARP